MHKHGTEEGSKTNTTRCVSERDYQSETSRRGEEGGGGGVRRGRGRGEEGDGAGMGGEQGGEGRGHSREGDGEEGGEQQQLWGWGGGVAGCGGA